jgi:hypothetical protein
LDGLLQAPGQLQDLRVWDPAHQESKFVAPHAGQQILLANLVLQLAGHLDQGLIPGQVPPAIVDELEVVQVQVEQVEGKAMAQGKGDLPLQLF